MLRPVPFFSALVVEADPAVARRMLRILGALAPGRHAPCVSTPEEAHHLLAAFSFDLVFVDMQLQPTGEGARLIARIRVAQPRSQVVAISHMDNWDLVRSAFAAGATGYLLSDAEDAEIAYALRALESGGVALDPRVGRRVLDMLAVSMRRGTVTAPLDAAEAPRRLRPRELQFLRLIADGLSNRQIADALEVSIHTVEFHARNAYRKLEVKSRTQAILEATRHGLLG